MLSRGFQKNGRLLKHAGYGAAPDVGDVGQGVLAVNPVLTLARITMATRGVLVLSAKLTSQPQGEPKDDIRMCVCSGRVKTTSAHDCSPCSVCL